MLLHFYHKNFAFDEHEVLAIEEPLTFWIERVSVSVVGISYLEELDSRATIVVSDFNLSLSWTSSGA